MIRLGAFRAFVLLIVGTYPAAAGEVRWQDPESVPRCGTSSPRFRAYDELFSSFLVEHRLPGVSVAVARHGRLVYCRGFGYADVQRRRVVRPADPFRVASVSKPITAVAILQLAERGRLALDDRAFEILGHRNPRDPRLAEITVRQLLQHTGGFDSKASFDPMFRSAEIAKSQGTPPPASARDVIREMLDRDLDFDPGARYAYSNFGYCVLGRIVENLSGTTYEKHVQRHVFRPLGVRGARIGRTRSTRFREACYYTASDETGPSVFAESLGRPVPSPYGAWHLEAMDSHGGWVASAPDLVRFASSLDDPSRSKLLGKTSIDSLFARPEGIWLDEDGRPAAAYYACGWMVRPVGGDGRNTWHTGSLPGTSSLLVRRHDGLVWAVLFNSRDTPSGREPATLVDPLMHEAAAATFDRP